MGLSFTMCRRIRDLLTSDGQRHWWSERAKKGLAEARDDYGWLTAGATTVTIEGPEAVCWWTFAGRAVNASLAAALRRSTTAKVSHDNFTVKIELGASTTDIERLIAEVRQADPLFLAPEIDTDAIAALKFSDCLPPRLVERMLQARAMDLAGLQSVLTEPVRFVVTNE